MPRGRTGDDLPDLEDLLPPDDPKGGDPEVDDDIDPDRDPEDPEVDDPDDIDDEADEPAEPPEDPDLAAEPLPERRGVSRPDRRIQSLITNGREKDRQISDLTRRLDALTQTVGSRQQPTRETEDARAARRALMSEGERISEDQRESSARHDAQIRQMAWNLQETSDKTSFEAQCRIDKLYKRFQPKVEEELANIRSQGQNVSREQMFYYLLGKATIDARNDPENKKARREAERRIRRETTRPSSNARSDATATQRERGTRITSLEKRLEGLNI